MPDIILFMLSAISIVIFVISLICMMQDYGKLDFATNTIFFLPVLFFIGWSIVYKNTPWRTEWEKEAVVETLNDGTQVISLENKLINVNEVFARSFQNGEEITITKLDNGFYYGIFPIPNKERYPFLEFKIKQKKKQEQEKELKQGEKENE